MKNKKLSKYINIRVNAIFKVAYFPFLSEKIKNDIRSNVAPYMISDLSENDKSKQYHIEDVYDILEENYRKDKTNIADDLKLIESLEKINVEYIEI